MNNVGKRIRDVRTKRGLSQEQLAESSKVNLRTIQRIENDETAPRGSTLKLIYEVLDIEVIENESVSVPINKYFIWSTFLTSLLIIGSCIGWLREVIGYDEFGTKIYNTLTGWNGIVIYGWDLKDGIVYGERFQNWMLSICALSIGTVVICNSLGIIENKKRYIALQLIYISIYLCALVDYINSIPFEIRPGLFLIIVATTLLVIAYSEKFVIHIGLILFLALSVFLTVALFILPIPSNPIDYVYVVGVGLSIVGDYFIIRHFLRLRKIARIAS